LRRAAPAAGALAFYGGLALALLGPLAYPELPDSNGLDLANHVAGIVEAKNALAEGQFPIRVAPHQVGGTRYPIFQYYGNLPYTLGGLLYRRAGLGPYTAWKLIVWASLTAGGCFTYLCGRRLARRRLPAVLGGALFLTAPYMAVDLHTRFAFTEVVAFNLLPVVLYAALRASRPSTAGILGSAAAWAALVLSHNIVFFYASFFFGLWFLSRTPWSRRGLVGLLGVGAGYALGLALTAWFWVPQALTLPRLHMRHMWGQVSDHGWLTPLGSLLSPGLTTPAPHPQPVPYPHFGLQIGWPLLAAVTLAVYCRFVVGMAGPRARRELSRLLAAFALALLFVWAPVDIYAWLPDAFSYVQFSYRLLMFVVLWGALLGACAVACRPGAALRFEHALVCLCLMGAAVGPHLAGHESARGVSVAAEVEHPDMGRGGGCMLYLPWPSASEFGVGCNYRRNLGPSPDDPDKAPLLRHFVRRVVPTQAGDTFSLTGEAVPGPCSERDPGRCREPSGTLRPHAAAGPETAAATDRPGSARRAYPDREDALSLRVSLGGMLLGTRTLAPGKFTASFAVPTGAAGREAELVVEAGGAGVRIATITALPPPPGPGRTDFIPPEQTAAATSLGRDTRYRAELARPALVVLPVLSYPHVLRVRDNGGPIPYGCVGTSLLLHLPAGSHEVEVRYVGVPWANGASLAAGVFLGLGLAGCGVRAACRRAPRRPGRLTPAAGSA
jgi:hypothetical protein